MLGRNICLKDSMSLCTALYRGFIGFSLNPISLVCSNCPEGVPQLVQ